MNIRMLNAIKADVTFQLKQGFYLVYILLTIIYMLIVHQLPEHMRIVVVPIVIFFDPSIVGFFFIGGIVMLEKTQGILDFLIVTPLRSKEYLMAKAISMAMLAILASCAITLVAYQDEVRWSLLILGIGISALIFTLYGFFVAAKCKSLNAYFIKMIPYMLLIVLPCLLLLVQTPFDWVFSVFPSVAGIRIVYGAFTGMHWLEAGLHLIYLSIITRVCLHIVDKKIFGGSYGE